MLLYVIVAVGCVNWGKKNSNALLEVAESTQNTAVCELLRLCVFCSDLR